MSVKQTYKYGLRHSRNILLIYGMYLLIAFWGLCFGNKYVSCIAFIACGIIWFLYKLDLKYTHNYIGLLLMAKDANNPKLMLQKFTGALSCRFEGNRYQLEVFEKRICDANEDIADLFQLRSYVKSVCKLTSFYNLSIVSMFGLIFIVACWISLEGMLYWAFIVFIVFIILDNLLTTYSLTAVVLQECDGIVE